MRKFWPTSENCRCSQIQFWFPLRVYLASNWLWLPIRVEFWCSLESNPSGQLIFHLVVKYTHDKSLAQQIVRTRQCVLSWSIVPTSTVFRNPAPVQILINWSGCGSFSLVLCASAIDFLVQESRSSLPISLLARNVDQIALPQHVSLFLFDSYCIRHKSETAP